MRLMLCKSLIRVPVKFKYRTRQQDFIALHEVDEEGIWTVQNTRSTQDGRELVARLKDALLVCDGNARLPQINPFIGL